MKFSIKDFFSKCDQICSFLPIWSHLLKKSLMENFILCTVSHKADVFEVFGQSSFYLQYTWEYRKGFIQTCSERFTQFLVELPWQVPASFLVKLVELYSATFSERILSRMFFRAFLKFFNKTVILQSTCEWSVLKITQNISFGKLHRKYCTNK